MAPRRRSLAIILDDAATRHAVTPATPAATRTPVANSTTAVFVAAVKTLARGRVDESVAKHVIRKCFQEQHERFSGNEELLGVRFLPNEDPHANITNFNAALVSARRRRRRSTLDVEERAAVDLNTIRLSTRECYANNVKSSVANGYSAATLTESTEEQSAIGDLPSIILDLKPRQVTTLTDHMDGTKGFTPRVAKPAGFRHRFVAKDLPTGGNWSQMEHKKRVVFHTRVAAANSAKQFGMHNMSLTDYENDLYAEQFQAGIDNDDGERFDALCFLAGGKPEMCRDDVLPRLAGTWSNQPVDTSMGGVHVDGVAKEVDSFTAVKINAPHEDTPPASKPPPVSDDGTDGSAGGCSCPAADTTQFVNHTQGGYLMQKQFGPHSEKFLTRSESGPSRPPQKSQFC
ncbi:hypothetical protein CYMTET_33351 [Cymbomonas tetramitiformis]|uniref:Uncharacterized protein n=1 Tax=Cymbomonas tetramitiformis TaxID=36881 RepID=A0AAE0KR16_9CHLO|nr:hypothetical protein CYMTET_33351 [Cymbomonas tetramitiformis]